MSKFAVIQTGGKQFIVKAGDKIQVEKLAVKEGDKVAFDNVLLVADGDKVEVGKPQVTGAKVEGKVLKQYFDFSHFRRRYLSEVIHAPI